MLPTVFRRCDSRRGRLCGLALGFPDRLEHGQHVIGFNLVDRHLTNDGISVVHKRLSPLVTVNLASQALEPISHITFRHFLERGRGMSLRCSGYNGLSTRMLDRIDSVIGAAMKVTFLAIWLKHR